MDNIDLDFPTKNDAKEIHRLIKNSPPLDLNSLYAYAVIAEHFGKTSCIATKDNRVVGFTSAYKVPAIEHRLFVWQVVVSELARGQGVAKKMLKFIIEKNPDIMEIETTINPSNKASFRLFESFSTSLGGGLKEESLFLGEEAFEDAHEIEQKYIFSLG
ncbi:MAG: diaminobutyrate acetyltransferase [Campylobacterales bacterium]